MAKKINIVFFGLCFITALILEIYCIHILNGDLFTTIGIGSVVLITGYLLLDTIRSQWNDSINSLKSDLETMQQDENERLATNLSQLFDLQKATYAATKKNTKFLQEEIKTIQDRLDSYEEEQQKAFEYVTMIQKKSMEGQKKALNLEINYNKENTKQIIDFFKEEIEKLEMKQERLFELLYQLEKNNASDMAVPNTEAENANSMNEETVIKPIYDDPNKNLTADEISSLFTTYGR